MNYNDRTPTINGNVRTKYVDLEETKNFTCDQPCICRFNNERSVKDNMYYDWFVLNKPIVMPNGKEMEKNIKK
jgi:hypothetical protein